MCLTWLVFNSYIVLTVVCFLLICYLLLFAWILYCVNPGYCFCLPGYCTVWTLDIVIVIVCLDIVLCEPWILFMEKGWKISSLRDRLDTEVFTFQMKSKVTKDVFLCFYVFSFSLLRLKSEERLVVVDNLVA